MLFLSFHIMRPQFSIQTFTYPPRGRLVVETPLVPHLRHSPAALISKLPFAFWRISLSGPQCVVLMYQRLIGRPPFCPPPPGTRNASKPFVAFLERPSPSNKELLRWTGLDLPGWRSPFCLFTKSLGASMIKMRFLSAVVRRFFSLSVLRRSLQWT